MLARFAISIALAGLWGFLMGLLFAPPLSYVLAVIGGFIVGVVSAPTD